MCLEKDTINNLLKFCGVGHNANELKSFLGIDNKLNFESHFKTFCSKAFQKLGSLERI